MIVNKVINILLVEDTESDVRLVQETFSDIKIPHQLYIVRDGDEALDFLFQRAQYSTAPRPQLILLDLNLPKKNGRQVLSEVKSDQNLRSIPTIILTSSRADEDIAKAYAEHANSYISKPIDLDTFMEVVNSIERYWLTTVELPKK